MTTIAVDFEVSSRDAEQITDDQEIYGTALPRSVDLRSTTDLGVGKPWAGTPVEALLAELKALKTEVNQYRVDEALAAACRTRQLMGALMEDDWLGSRILVQMRHTGFATATEIAAALQVGINPISCRLADLFKAEVIKIKDHQELAVQGVFTLTESGIQTAIQLEEMMNSVFDD